MSGPSVILTTLSLGKPPRGSLQVLSAYSWALTENSYRIRGRMVIEIFSLSNLQERMCQTRGSIAVPLASYSASLPIELPCPVWKLEAATSISLHHRVMNTQLHLTYIKWNWGLQGYTLFSFILCFALNTDRGYSLQQWGGSNVYLRTIYEGWSKIT